MAYHKPSHPRGHEGHKKETGKAPSDAGRHEHTVHITYNEHSCDLASFPESARLPSWAVLDHGGKLIAEQSHNPEERKDPASTTKLWTLYTVASLIKEGTLPKDFITKHRHQIDEMMVRSNNQEALNVAWEAGRLIDKNGAGTDDVIVGKFCQKMNSLAHENGLNGSHFDVPNGMPNPNNYSTAHDMARIAYVFDRDFPKLTYLAGQKRVDSVGINTGIVPLKHGWVWGKTGTGGGCHQPKGTISYVGKTDDGHYAALSGAEGKSIFHKMVTAIPHALEHVFEHHPKGLEVTDVHPDHHAHGHTPSYVPKHPLHKHPPHYNHGK